MEIDERVQIMNVDFGSPAARFGLDFGFDITEVLVPADRPAKEWFFVPALLLLGLIVWDQRRRREPRPAPAERAAFGED